MTDPLSEQSTRLLLEVARKAALQKTNDVGLAEEAASTAVQTLGDCLDSLRGGPAVYQTWVKRTATRYVARVGQRQARNVPFGKAGSVPPPAADDTEKKVFEQALGGMNAGSAPSLGSDVADRLDLEVAMKSLKPAARELLEMKYAQGYSSREIADRTGKTVAAVDMALSRAKDALQPLLGDLDEGEE